MDSLIIGFAAAFNFLIIKWKFEKERYDDACLDIFLLGALSYMFGGTMGGMIIATIGSAVVSVSLLIKPPNFNQRSKRNDKVSNKPI